MSREQQQAALDLIAGRDITNTLADRLVGWVQGYARDDLRRGIETPVSQALAEFVAEHRAAIMACPESKP